MSNTFSKGGEKLLKVLRSLAPSPRYGPGDNVVKSNLFAD